MTIYMVSIMLGMVRYNIHMSLGSGLDAMVVLAVPLSLSFKVVAHRRIQLTRRKLTSRNVSRSESSPILRFPSKSRQGESGLLRHVQREVSEQSPT